MLSTNYVTHSINFSAAETNDNGDSVDGMLENKRAKTA